MALPGMNLAKGLLHSIDENGSHMTVKPLLIAMGVALFLFLVFVPGQFFRNFSLVLFTAPIWMPPILVYFAFQRWVEMRRSDTIKGTDTVLLELRLPRDTLKTPLAMELIFANMHMGSGESTWYKKWWLGRIRAWWSVEIVSLGGQVRFFLWTRTGMRRGIESFFYAQYPGIELIEAEDYSRLFDPTAKENEMFGAEFRLLKPDPYPIKTYTEYGLDRAGAKPEEQIDPLAQIIELMASLGPKEQLWLQIIFRQTKSEKFGSKKSVDGKAFTWKDEATELIEKIRASTMKEGSYVDPVTGKVQKTQGFPNPSKGQSEAMAAIEKNISKPGFDVGIRAIYSAPKDAYQGSMIGFLLSMFNPFNNQAYNVLGPLSLFSAKFNDYPWEDRHGHHKAEEEKNITEYYRRRAYFHSPYIGPWMILSSEELATLFHVPSSSVATPSLPRIQSATSGAPSNLPT